MARPQPRFWVPKNPDKYIGDAKNIVARSSWEVKFFNWCDNNPSILAWASEEVVVPYISPVDNRTHRYFTDAIIKVQTNNGIKVYLIEIKPYAQTQPPIPPQKKTKRFLNEVMTYGVNIAKWKAATKYAEQRNWEFKVLTERDLY